MLALLALSLAACPLGRGSAKLGETCDHNNGCADARCEANLCTKACKSDADCSPAAVKMVCKGNLKTDTNPEAWGVCAAP